MRRTLVLSSLGGLLAVAALVGWQIRPMTAQQPAQAPEPAVKAPAVQLPVGQVVLFSSGVGYFQREGSVDGNTRVDMSFATGDINDLLKSMVLQDEGGGRVSTVSYGSKDPLTRTLATFSIDLTQNPTLADLLNQIRGEQIEIDAPTKITGTILGVEKRQVPAGKDDKVVEEDHLTLLTDDGLRSLALDRVGRIKLKNEKLDVELRKALAVLATSKSQDKKAVALSFLGQGKRPVRVGYIQEAPIWKTNLARKKSAICIIGKSGMRPLRFRNTKNNFPGL